MWNTRVRGLIAVDSLVHMIDNLAGVIKLVMIKTAEVNNMSDMEQFQIVVSEIQSIRQQMASLNAQILELKATSEAVSNQPKELALHQQLGGVLIEVADRESLVKVLESDINTLSEHLTRLQSREGDLIDSYEELKKVLEG